MAGQGVHGAGASEAGNGEQQLITTSQLRIAQDELLGGASETVDGPLLGLDAALEVATNEGRNRPGERGGMPAIFLRRHHVGEGFETARRAVSTTGRVFSIKPRWVLAGASSYQTLPTKAE